MMQLTNFQIIDARGNIEIVAMGQVWNLHDATYAGLRQGFLYDEQGLLTSSRVELAWQVDPARYGAASLRLRFHDIQYFEVTPRDDELPLGEDTCLSSVGRVSAEDETSELKRQGYINTEASDAEEAHLYFRFRGGQTVRIFSRTAEFVRYPEGRGEWK